MRFNYLSILIGSLVIASFAAASLDLKPGDLVPILTMKAVDGSDVDTAKMKGSTLVLLFAETSQPQTERGIQLIINALDSAQLNDQSISWLLILSKHSDPENLLNDFTKSKRKPIIIHDTKRKAFGAYRTVVTPSVVIADKHGKFVHALTGFTPNFGDTVLDAMLVSAGKMTLDSFDKNLKGSIVEVKDEKHLKAERLTQFAKRLAQRNMTSLAEAQYRQALELVPDMQIARLGLAEILLSQEKTSEAHELFQSVLDQNPDSELALLGLATVSLKRDPPDIAHAQVLVERAIKRNAFSARGHYMLGTIHERQGDWAKAAISYKSAAELLLKRPDMVEKIPIPGGSE